MAIGDELTRSEKADRFDQLERSLGNFRKRAKDAAIGATQTVETNVTALGMGLLRGYLGPKGFTILGQDADGIIGIAAHIGALYQGGTMAAHLHAIGNGGTAPWLARMAETWGANYATTHGVTPMSGYPRAGALPSRSSQDPTALNNLMRAMGDRYARLGVID